MALAEKEEKRIYYIASCKRLRSLEKEYDALCRAIKEIEGKEVTDEDTYNKLTKKLRDLNDEKFKTYMSIKFTKERIIKLLVYYGYYSLKKSERIIDFESLET